jgi:ribosomal RNA-processing protein 12
VRLPVDVLQPWLPQMLEGLLLWCEDSKNKFKLKVRAVVERLAKRCGFEAMAAAMPPSDTRLLAHIRKEASRKQRRASQAGSVVSAARWC